MDSTVCQWKLGQMGLDGCKAWYDMCKIEIDFQKSMGQQRVHLYRLFLSFLLIAIAAGAGEARGGVRGDRQHVAGCRVEGESSKGYGGGYLRPMLSQL